MPTSSEISQKSKTALLWVASTTLISQLISWVMTFWTAHLLHPEDYGIIALAETVVPYLALIASLNIATWMIQTAVLSSDDENVSFTLALSLGVTAALLLFLLAPTLSHFYNSPPLTMILRLLSFTFILRGCATVPDALLRRELRFRELGLMSMLVGLFRGLLQVLLAFQGFGVWALVWGILFREVVESLTIIGLRRLPTGISVTREKVKTIISFGVPLTAGTIFWMAYSSADLVIVGKIFGIETLGFYSMAITIVSIPMSKINQISGPVLLPYFSRLNDSISIGESFLRINRYIASIVFPALLGLTCISPDLVPLLIGSKWLPAVPMLQVLALISVMKAVVDTIPVTLVALGRPSLNFQINCVALLFIPALLLGGGVLYGLKGIYYGWFVAQTILTTVTFWIISPSIGISVATQLANLFKPFVVTALMTGAVIAFRQSLPDEMPLAIKVAGECGTGVLVYICAYWILFRSEALRILDFVRNLRK